MALCDMGILELRQMLDNKEISSVELTQYYLDRIRELDSKVESYITVCDEEAMIAAKKCGVKINLY